VTTQHATAPAVGGLRSCTKDTLEPSRLFASRWIYEEIVEIRTGDVSTQGDPPRGRIDPLLFTLGNNSAAAVGCVRAIRQGMTISLIRERRSLLVLFEPTR
jgi:hypothetical protein